MILDNDDCNSEVLIQVLDFIGKFTYQLFSTPSELLNALKQAEPDVIFCNVTMRGSDARELCNNKEIKIPFIFISVLYPSEERRICYLESGHPYITSPLTPQLIQQHL